MHPVIVENLEEYMTGSLLPGARREFETHLEACSACREQVRGMKEISAWFEELRPVEAVMPSPGFTARVMRQVAETPAPSFWSLLSVDPGFGRRVVFASLLTLAVLGGYLVSRETDYSPALASPEAVMAIDQHPARQGPHNDRDLMLVTLTSYEP
jgi:anti-sigma factor RsiW